MHSIAMAAAKATAASNHTYFPSRLLLLLLLVATAALPCHTMNWRPGWGFGAHGGFPANPWHSWRMNQSTVAYFVGNASGMDSEAELGLEARLGYVGIGWQLNNIPSHHSHLETCVECPQHWLHHAFEC